MFGKVIAAVESSHSGLIHVVERFGRRELITFSKDGNQFSQSGPIVAKLWAPVLRNVLKKYQSPSVLILGLGGGTVIHIIKTYQPQTAITVVEIDPAMVEIATTYFGIDPIEVSLFLDDAQRFVTVPKDGAYEIICVDLFCHEQVPTFLEDSAWLAQLGRILSPQGTIIINRLLYGKHRQTSQAYIDKLRSIFYIKEVNWLPSRFAASNVLIMCSKDVQSRTWHSV